MKFTLTICLFLFYSYRQSQNNDDSTAIVKLLEKAATTLRSGDAKAYADCWKIRPYSVVFISTDDRKATMTRYLLRINFLLQD